MTVFILAANAMIYFKIYFKHKNNNLLFDNNFVFINKKSNWLRKMWAFYVLLSSFEVLNGFKIIIVHPIFMSLKCSNVMNNFLRQLKFLSNLFEKCINFKKSDYQ